MAASPRSAKAALLESSRLYTKNLRRRLPEEGEGDDSKSKAGEGGGKKEDNTGDEPAAAPKMSPHERLLKEKPENMERYDGEKWVPAENYTDTGKGQEPSFGLRWVGRKVGIVDIAGDTRVKTDAQMMNKKQLGFLGVAITSLTAAAGISGWVIAESIQQEGHLHTAGFVGALCFGVVAIVCLFFFYKASKKQERGMLLMAGTILPVLSVGLGVAGMVVSTSDFGGEGLGEGQWFENSDKAGVYFGFMGTSCVFLLIGMICLGVWLNKNHGWQSGRVTALTVGVTGLSVLAAATSCILQDGIYDEAGESMGTETHWIVLMCIGSAIVSYALWYMIMGQHKQDWKSYMPLVVMGLSTGCLTAGLVTLGEDQDVLAIDNAMDFWGTTSGALILVAAILFTVAILVLAVAKCRNLKQY